MNPKIVILLWAILSISIVFFHIKSLEDNIPLSDCHLANIQWHYERPMCTECKLFCEVKK